LLRSGAQDILRHVVQKVGFHVEFCRIAVALRNRYPRLDGACRPPTTRRRSLRV
jgi:hypothetical protein